MPPHRRPYFWRSLWANAGLPLLLAVHVCYGETTNALPWLQNAEEVRNLTPAQAERHYPVRLRGLVTYYDHVERYHFVQDETAGVYFKYLDNPKAPELRDGEIVEIEGESDKGDYAPVIIAKKITVLGQQTLPLAKPVTFEDLASGQEDSQFVEIRGVVRSFQTDQFSNQMVHLFSGGQKLTVLLQKVTPTECERLPDSVVRVRGVCAPRFNRQNQLFENWFLAPRHEDLIVEKPAPENPFDVPVQSLGSLLGFNPKGTFGHRVKVEGTVTYRPTDTQMFLQDRRAGLSVATAQAGSLQPGDRVEALGFLAFGDYTPVMEDAIFRKISGGSEPAPDLITADTALLGTNDCRLVRLSATVLDRAIHSPQPFLVLQSGGVIFHAQMVGEENGGSLADLQNGSQVTVTGICRVEKGEYWNSGEAWRAKSFRILLRSPEDIKVVRLPPWWTLEKLLWITGILLLVVFGGSAWVAILRRRVELLQQRESLQRERIRISQDIHDEIGSKLAKISYLSDAVMRETTDKNTSAAKVTSIAQTSRDLLSSLDRTVWAVNPSNDSLEQLVNYLGQYATEYFQDTPIECQLQLARSLPAVTFFSEMRHNVLLAFEEVLSNIVKHSGANRVQVRMSLNGSVFEILVEDNGRGFTADKFSGPAPDGASKSSLPRHGLSGLSRRLAEAGGRCEFKSEPGRGTSVRFVLPLNNISPIKI